MQKLAQDQLRYSPTDIVRFLESPFASWMERLYLERPGQVTPDEDSDELKLIAAEGIRHEERFLASLQSEGRAVTTIERTSKSRQKTREAIDRGDSLIFQAHLAHGSFAGYADFLSVADEDSCTYEVWDTKLARTAKPHYLIQLCCYAEMLEGMGYARPETLRLVLGNDEMQTFRTADYIFAYAEAKRAFLDQMDSFDPDVTPTPDPRADHGRWASHAERELVKKDHLVQVAGISTGQIKKLEDGGINTLTALAETALTSIPKLHPDIFLRLREQARLQLKTKQRQTESSSPIRPSFEVLAHPEEEVAQGLALLPPASPNDIFFDLEGYPLAEGGQGLEYLFGATHLTLDGVPQFADWWAHNPAQEQAAFEAFIDWAYARWVADPGMHIYHYAPYEITALRRLMGTYGTREKEVDDLLRHGVFIDLYQVVRQGIRLGEDSYSLKKVERLYMEARGGEVKTAASSIVFYARWMESEQADTWQESEILNEIRDYNREDCDSTWRLAEWLREQQQQHQISWRPNSSKAGGEAPAPTVLPPEVVERQQLASLLLEAAAKDSDEDNARISRLLAHLLDYHRREDKPVWWAVFERRGMTPEELVEDSDCLGNLRRTEDPPVSIKRSTGYWYAFDPGQDTKLSEGKRAGIVPDLPAKVSIEELDLENGRALLKVGNGTLEKLEGGLPESLSLIPEEYVNPEPMPASIQAIAEAWLQHRTLPEALRKLLLREAPITKDPVLVRPKENATAAAVRIASQMDGATLCIQGPPGTGKTYTGAKVIIDLLAQGKNIGVVSNSHKAVLNFLGECVDQSDQPLAGIKVGGEGGDPFFDKALGFSHVKGSADAVARYSGGLIAGTAWLFSRDDMVNQLDYLVIDEAGQVSLANLVAMSRAARNLILLGDQMQLAQPVKGSHPGESGQSALNYYLNGHPTIPADLGILLPETRRMRPEICSFISEAVYEGRLTAHESTSDTSIEGVTAGIFFEPVEHDGNVQESDEESQRVAEMVADLLGQPYTEDGHPPRTLTLDDILIVAPYNRQVRNLQRHLPEGSRIGTVDKFQGQQAAVVIVSLAASPGEFGSRGLKFLLDKNRLNVALSRAKCRAILVADPRIASYGYSSLGDMERVNLLCRILETSERKDPEWQSDSMPVDPTPMASLSEISTSSVRKSAKMTSGSL